MAVQTQIQVRRGTASSWTSTNPTLAAGEIGFESDTGKFKIGNGSSTWNALAYTANGGIPESLIDAKGDLIVGSAADTAARLAVGSNGYQLVADSSASTGLGWASNFAAGKNKIINGDFGVWQRGTSTTTEAFQADRFNLSRSGDTFVYSQQSFTPGTAPVAGYETAFFARIAVTSVAGASNFSQFLQRIENVRTLAGQTATFSFWAKADAAKSVSIELQQNFGSGGSASVDTFVAKQALTTSWVRYSFTFTVPSVSGKTIGAGSYADFRVWLSAGSNFDSRTNTLGQQNITFDTWGWQVEAGNVATAFQTATGTIQGELAACQRYYWLLANGNNQPVGTAMANSTTQVRTIVQYPVTMRTTPTLDQATGSGYYTFLNAGAFPTFSSLTMDVSSANAAWLYSSTLGANTTAGYAGSIYTTNASAKLAFTAEL